MRRSQQRDVETRSGGRRVCVCVCVCVHVRVFKTHIKCRNDSVNRS
jgi:hypothetical protein